MFMIYSITKDHILAYFTGLLRIAIKQWTQRGPRFRATVSHILVLYLTSHMLYYLNKRCIFSKMLTHKIPGSYMKWR